MNFPANNHELYCYYCRYKRLTFYSITGRTIFTDFILYTVHSPFFPFFPFFMFSLFSIQSLNNPIKTFFSFFISNCNYKFFSIFQQAFSRHSFYRLFLHFGISELPNTCSPSLSRSSPLSSCMLLEYSAVSATVPVFSLKSSKQQIQ